MTMIERVAEGIGEYRSSPDDGPLKLLLSLGERRAIARAALEAMRDCTMLLRQDGAIVHEVRGAPDDLWKAFLDGALTEQPAPADSGIPVYKTGKGETEVFEKGE